MNSEQRRLEEARNPNTPWKKWGPCLSAGRGPVLIMAPYSVARAPSNRLSHLDRDA